MVLVEKQVPFELVLVDLANREHNAPEYLEKHPFGQVPLIDDDGFILYETHVICRYIAENYADQGTPLIPTEFKAKALFEQAALIEYSNFNPYTFAMFFEGLSKPHRGLQKDKAAFDKAVSDLSAKLDAYEVILGKQKYMAGDELTLADLAHLAFGGLLEPAGCDLMTNKGPNIAQRWKDITSRPSLVNLQKDCIKSTAP
ncbi:glutathione S-transferase [Mycena sp. CBHHK59/15]|nr:glutathione S-transferase [Mycena sp. CBHHK59/15]